MLMRIVAESLVLSFDADVAPGLFVPRASLRF